MSSLNILILSNFYTKLVILLKLPYEARVQLHKNPNFKIITYQNSDLMLG